MTTYTTGATRNDHDEAIVPHLFNSALVDRRFATYMHEHRKQADGSLRPGDNWKNGIPRDDYMASIARHYLDLCEIHERNSDGIIDRDYGFVTMQDVLCALRFNINGMLYELIKADNAIQAMTDDDDSDYVAGAVTPDV